MENRVPVLLGLAYLLVWYRNRIGWDLDEDEQEVTTANKKLGDEEKDLTLEESSSPASISGSIAKNQAELDVPSPAIPQETVIIEKTP